MTISAQNCLWHPTSSAFDMATWLKHTFVSYFVFSVFTQRHSIILKIQIYVIVL